MEIRKRFGSAGPTPLKDGKDATAEKVELEVQKPEESHIVPGIPPRSSVHAKSRSKAVLYSSYFLVLSLLAGGAWWWADQLPVMPSGAPEESAPQNSVEKKASTAVTPSASPPVQKVKEVAAEMPVEPPKQAPVLEKPPAPMPKPTMMDKPVSSSQPKPQVQMFKKIVKHKVEQEETLYRISQNYYQSGKYANFLARYNGIRHPSDLKYGMVIRVPFPPVK